MSAQAEDGTGVSPFHAGELQVQEQLGVRDRIGPWASRVIRPFMPDQHREFYGMLPFIVAAARDGRERPWVTMLAGHPGFIASPDDRHLEIRSRLGAGDPLAEGLFSGTQVGLLGIDLESRRRNRVNGRLTAEGRVLRFAVDQSFGNCPQYIHPREWVVVDELTPNAVVQRAGELTESQRLWIRAADTFFIASGYGDDEQASSGMDASHRGGPAGFVEVRGDRRIVFPDYAGNNLYNTIGNLVMDPRVGLVFVDFETGSLLHLTGRATIDWDSPAVDNHPGAQRLVVIDIEEVVEQRGALPIRWKSPRGAVRDLRVVDKVPETEDVVSIVLASRDGGVLPDYEPGQHLPIEVRLPGESRPALRTYSLSDWPADGQYRISVKREPSGSVSQFLHDQLETGDILLGGTPAGEFVLQPGDRPVVLVSAGIGATPMVSMLRALDTDPSERRAWYIHGARDGDHHALAKDVSRLVTGNDRLSSHIRFSRPTPGDLAGRDYDSAGHVDVALVEYVVGTMDADFYVCGPVTFMADIVEGLEARSVPNTSIFTESFGSVAGRAGD